MEKTAYLILGPSTGPLKNFSKVRAMSNDRIVRLAQEVNRYSNEEYGTVDEVVEAVLEERVSSLSESEEAVEEKQAELRSKFGIDDGDSEEAELTEAESKQQELRERFNR